MRKKQVKEIEHKMNNFIKSFVIYTITLALTIFVFWYFLIRTIPEYKNCTELHADGKQNIIKSDPLYRPSLDRDKDGYACER